MFCRLLKIGKMVYLNGNHTAKLLNFHITKELNYQFSDLGTNDNNNNNRHRMGRPNGLKREKSKWQVEVNGGGGGGWERVINETHFILYNISRMCGCVPCSVF